MTKKQLIAIIGAIETLLAWLSKSPSSLPAIVAAAQDFIGTVPDNIAITNAGVRSWLNQELNYAESKLAELDEKDLVELLKLLKTTKGTARLRDPVKQPRSGGKTPKP